MDRTRFQDFLVKKYRPIVYSSSAITYMIFFMSGIGRYRSVIFISIYFFAKALSDERIGDKFLKAFFAPFLIVLILLDLQFGRFYPINGEMNIWLLCAVLLTADPLIKYVTSRFLIHLSGGAIFITCQKCNYDNRDLVAKCSNCGFQKGMPLHAEDSHSTKSLSKEIKEEIGYYNRIGLYLQLSPTQLNSLNLDENESVLISKRIYSQPIYKNEIRLLVSFLLITTERIIFIDEGLLRSGWGNKEIINFNEIAEIQVEKKFRYINYAPSISIKTHGKAEYIFIYHVKKRNYPQIAAIIECIKKRKPALLVSISDEFKNIDL